MKKVPLKTWEFAHIIKEISVKHNTFIIILVK